MYQSFKAASTIPAERIVVVNSSGNAALGTTFGNTTTSANAVLGVSKDYANTNEGVNVATGGEVCRLYFNDTITAGQLFGSDASGYGIPIPAVSGLSGSGYAVGIALQTVAVTGSVIDVLVQPSCFKRA
jgi:hypothetical protein